MKFKPHILAEVYLLPTIGGGRRMATPTDVFGCPVRIGTEYFDMRMDLTAIGSLSPGDIAQVPIRFLWPDYVRPLLCLGSRFTLWDLGTIGHGRVIEIYESLAA
jgi:hypothetical protein